MGKKGLFSACFGSHEKEQDAAADKTTNEQPAPSAPAIATPQQQDSASPASSTPPLQPSIQATAERLRPPAVEISKVASSSSSRDANQLRPEASKKGPDTMEVSESISRQDSNMQDSKRQLSVITNSFNNSLNGDTPENDNPYINLPVNTLGHMTLEALAYEIQQLTWIGQGGFGTVYKGIWQGAPVAVKFMCTNSLDLSSATAREAVLSKLLSHPNVVQTFASKVAKLDENFFTAIALMKPPATSRDNEENTTSKATYSTECRESFVSGEGFGNPFEKSKEATNIRDVLFHVDAKPGDYLTQIVMEYCDKGSLQQAINKGLFKASPTWSSRLALRAYLRTAREVAQGLCHIHKSNVIHGDLKPANVLLKGSRLDRRGFVGKVSDFGLSLVCDKSVVNASNWGTIGYMAPEAFEDQLTKASDVYSFGVLLWEMYVGERPYVGMHPGQIVVGVQTGELRPQWPPQAPTAVVRLSQRCLDQDHSNRPSFEYIMKQLRLIESDVRMENHKEQRAARRAQAAQMAAESGSWRTASGESNQISRESKISLVSGGSDKTSLFDDDEQNGKAKMVVSNPS